MGDCYLSGIGTEKNHEEALRYYKMAADFGFGPGQFNCGILYKKGKKPDFHQSYYYLSLAAQNFADLDELTQNAAYYRDEVGIHLSKEDKVKIKKQIKEMKEF
jgi:TPR repeat protein